MDARALARGLAMRCPVCGERRLFERFFRIKAQCPGCGLTFEREEGYWLGAMTVAMALVIAVFAVVFVGGMLVTWPDVPWTGLLIATDQQGEAFSGILIVDMKISKQNCNRLGQISSVW
jgi:uncharacterized protein (DUF983 family)